MTNVIRQLQVIEHLKKHESGIRSQKCKLRDVIALGSSSRTVGEGLHVVGDLQPQVGHTCQLLRGGTEQAERSRDW